MDTEQLRRLGEAGALKELADGKRGVRVSLQYQPAVSEGTRQQRRDRLAACFSRVAADVEARGASIDLGSLSPSAQTVEAVLPIDAYDDLVSELQSAHSVRVDPIVP